MARSLRPAARAPTSPRRLADEELMQLAGANDASAFELIFEPHVDLAYALNGPLGIVKGRMRLGLAVLRGSLAGWEATA